MSDTRADLVRRYLEDAIAAEKTLAAELRQFAGEGDDEDVQAAFRAYADEVQRHSVLLEQRLGELGGSASEGGRAFAHAVSDAAGRPVTAHIQEERTVQNLLLAFGTASGKTALYEALALVSTKAGDEATAALAHALEEEEQHAAARMSHFLRSRSKIAFNMLTPNELDPAVETKAFDNPVV